MRLIIDDWSCCPQRSVSLGKCIIDTTKLLRSKKGLEDDLLDSSGDIYYSIVGNVGGDTMDAGVLSTSDFFWGNLCTKQR